MDKIKRVTADELRLLAEQKGFPQPLLAKDYFITVLLYLLQDLPGIYFKGGTALNKVFLNYARLSEDIDFTVTGDISLIQQQIGATVIKSGFFKNITKDHTKDLFVRLIVNYEDPLGRIGSIFIDLNKKGNLLLPPEQHRIPHFYTHSIPEFSSKTVSFSEMLAEKMRATIERNKPRDHFDLYQIITNKLPLDLQLVRKKCAESGSEFDITKMFNRANRLKQKWDEDLGPLLAQKVSFQEVMTTLAKHFHLKEVKEKKKKAMQELGDSPAYQKLLKDIKSILARLPPEQKYPQHSNDKK